MESCFTNVGNDLRVYLTLMMTNCIWGRSFCKLQDGRMNIKGASSDKTSWTAWF